VDSVTHGLLEAITHAALGAAAGELLLGKKLANRALRWGGLFGILPDLLDALIAVFSNTAWRLMLLRGPSHSLVFLLAATIGLPFWLSRLWKREKISRARLATLVFLPIAGHLLLDVSEVRGLKPLSPFSSQIFALNGPDTLDPFVAVPLVLSVVWLACFNKKDARRQKWAVRGLLTSGLYLLFGFGMKAWVSSGFDADLERRQVKFERRMECPVSHQILLWRSVVDRGGEFWIGDRSLFDAPSGPIRWTIIPKQQGAFSSLADSREGRALEQSSGGWWIARPTAKGVWIADLRLGETRAWEKKGTVDLRPTFAWQWSKDGHLQKISTDRHNVGENLRETGHRIVCQRDAWDAVPRLAGITGTLPEQLEWKE